MSFGPIGASECCNGGTLLLDEAAGSGLSLTSGSTELAAVQVVAGAAMAGHTLVEGGVYLTGAFEETDLLAGEFFRIDVRDTTPVNATAALAASSTNPIWTGTINANQPVLRMECRIPSPGARIFVVASVAAARNLNAYIMSWRALP